jgi:hypothetical protein
VTVHKRTEAYFLAYIRPVDVETDTFGIETTDPLTGRHRYGLIDHPNNASITMNTNPGEEIANFASDAPNIDRYRVLHHTE